MSKADDRSYEYDDFGKVKCRPIYDPGYKWSRTPREEYQHYIIQCNIESGLVDPNSVNENGEPLWHYICQSLSDDNVDLATSLFSLRSEKYQPVQIDAQDNFGWTALHLAVYNDLERITEFLLNHNANPNLANDKGETPLHVICRIDKYRSIDTSDNNLFNSIHPSEEAYNQRRQFVERQKRMIEMLLSRDANPNAPDAKRFTPLHIVCQKKCDDDYVRSMSLREFQPTLNLATYRNHQSVIESMLRRGANPNLTNDKEETPLHLICKGYGDNHQLAKTLVELAYERYRPIPVDARDGNGETPLHLALRKCNKQLVDWLLRRGANRTLANSKGETPLHVICQGNRVAAYNFARWIFGSSAICLRAQFHTQDNLNNTPLHLATSHGHLRLIDCLLKNGANPTLVNDKGETPLHNICRRGNGQLVKTLFKICDEQQLQLQVDVKDGLGRTPLQLAVANFRLDVIDVLLDRGADLSSFVFPDQPHFYERFNTNVEGQFAMKVELASGIMMVVEHLVDKGFDLERSDALTIMKLFAEYGLFEKSPTIEESFNNENFANREKRVIIKPNLSLHDLIQLRPKEAAKQLTYSDYFEFVRSNDELGGLSTRGWCREGCVAHLCEKLSSIFFRRWALYPFQKLINYRLPVEICEIIIEKLANEDLYHICLTDEGQSDKDLNSENNVKCKSSKKDDEQ